MGTGIQEFEKFKEFENEGRIVAFEPQMDADENQAKEHAIWLNQFFYLARAFKF